MTIRAGTQYLGMIHTRYRHPGHRVVTSRAFRCTGNMTERHTRGIGAIVTTDTSSISYRGMIHNGRRRKTGRRMAGFTCGRGKNMGGGNTNRRDAIMTSCTLSGQNLKHRTHMTRHAIN